MNSKRILVADNNAQDRKTIARYLEIEGYLVLQAQDTANALRYMQQLVPDLILADSQLPPNGEGDFYNLVRQNPQWTAIPFIFLAQDASPREMLRVRALGGEDYLPKPIDQDSLARIVSARLLRAAELQTALIDQAYLETITVLANTVEGRDPYTHGHVERVTTYARWLAQAMNWPKDHLRSLEFGARLHDIGKIVVPDHILKKPGGLTAEEWEVMRQHPTEGGMILERITHLKPALNYVLYHHERWDGSGYPRGLAGRDIPIEGRLLAIADVYDALTTNRPYHPARSHADVVQYLTTYAGTHFDPDLVRVFLGVIEEHPESWETSELRVGAGQAPFSKG